MSGPQAADPRDARIRLLEHQADYLRKELEFVNKRHARVIYSVAWRLAIPFRIVEGGVKRLLEFWTNQKPAPRAPALSREPSEAVLAPPVLPRRLLVDVTDIAAGDQKTGIQRVVRNVVAALSADKSFEPFTPTPVRIENGRMIACRAFVAGLMGCPATAPDLEIGVETGDCLLLLDKAWSDFASLDPLFSRIRENGGLVVACIYDLIPELYRGASIGAVPEIYAAWLRAALLSCDGMIAISQTVAEELCDYVEREELPHRDGFRVGWFHLGSELDGQRARNGAPPSADVAASCAPGKPVFAIVGTVEPRKGHDIALAAFDTLWKRGFSGRLVLLGRKGWNVEALIADIRAHALFGKDLFWFDDAGDNDLAYIYAHCAAVLCPSYAEGFGLPLSEAAHAGRPVICSDIPVFHEVGRDGAIYFRVNDSDALADAVEGFSSGRVKADPVKILQVTWPEAADRIADVVMRGAWSKTLGPKNSR